MEKGGDHLNFLSSNTSLDWRFGSAQPTYMVPNQNANAVCKGNPLNTYPSSSISMVDSFSSTVWDHPSSQNLSFCTNNENQSSVSTSNVVASRNMGPGTSQSGAMEEVLNVGVGCNPLNSVSKGGFFLQTGINVFPQNSTDVPTDSAFIERAARLSCFNNGGFSNLANLFSISESSYRGGIHMLEVPSGNGCSAVDGVQSQKNEAQMAEVVKDGMPVDHEVMESCLTKNEGETTGLLVSSDQGKDGLGASNNESDEAEFSGSIHEEQSVLENSVREPSVRTLGGKKRKRNTQFSQLETELDQGKGSPQLSVENTKENIETKQKIEQNATVMGTKTTGKRSKDSCKNSDAPKEEYIHVRARRGQATNSHSLAERVRREKISERMKYLQDLVPGCSKITGKAVVLDEIINYVQSLQQQVEFLSMKIAAVNPQLDLNIEALLSKDIFQSHAGTATHGVFPDMGMAHPQMHLLQQGLIQAGIPSIGNHSEFLRRFISSQLTAINGFKEPTPQINNSWNDELHNVVQMNFGINGPFNNQELNGSLPPGQMKVEL